MPFQPGHESWNKGKKLTKEHRRKLSEAHKGLSSPYKGSKTSDKTRLNMSIAAMANSPHPRLGATLTQDHKDKITRANTGRKHTVESRKLISDSLQAVYKERTSKRRSESLKKYYETHEVWNKGLRWPEDVKERIRQTCIGSEVGKWNRKKQG